MPTYICTTAPERLNSTQKSDIVKAITTIHSEEGKAPGYLVQVIFNEVTPENRFINNRQVTADEVWIHGHIRAGRTDEQKTAMAKRMVEETAAICELDDSYVWAYVSDLAKAAEFGSVLPQPGEEKEWFAALSDDVKNRYGLNG